MRFSSPCGNVWINYRTQDGGFYLYALCPHCGKRASCFDGHDWVVDVEGGKIRSVSPSLDIKPHKHKEDETIKCPGWHGYYRNYNFESV